MKKLFFLVLVLALAIGACAKQQAGSDLVGQGSDVSQQMPAGGSNAEEMIVSQDDFKEFRIQAKQFLFDPGIIEVNKWDKVRLIVTSIDVPHGFSIKEYGINERLDVGKPVTIEFVADKEGTFTAFCSVACGAGHSNMKGQIIVK